MKYDELTNRLGKFLLGDKRTGRPALIDLYEHGQMVRGRPLPINVKEDIANKRLGRPKKFSRTGIAQHLSFRETFYYRSNRSSGFALLKIDIDAHNGEHDALAVAQTIEQLYLPGCYHEPSTGGRGRHLYAVIAFDPYSPRQMINRWFEAVGVSLRTLMRARGFEAAVDPKTCKTFSIFGEDSWGNRIPICMGQFSKLPRPRSLKDMDRIEAAPFYLPCALNRIIDDCKNLRAERDGRTATKKAAVHAPAARRAVEAHRVAVGAFIGMNAADPRSRAVHAVAALARNLGRMPCVAEARIFYEEAGLATVAASGDTVKDVRRREKRLAAAVIHVEKTFDAQKAGKGFNAEVLLMLVREKVLPQHREGLKYKYKIKNEELAAALYVVELASFERKEKRDDMWTVGHNRIAGMLSKLARERKEKEEKDINTCVSAHQAGPFNVKGVNRNKVRAVIVILQRAGLIDTIDESYRPGRGKSKNSNTCVSAHHDVGTAWEEIGRVRGRCKRIVVGANHPRRQEWERERDLFAAWVFGGQHPTSKRHVSNTTSAPKIGGLLLMEV